MTSVYSEIKRNRGLYFILNWSQLGSQSSRYDRASANHRHCCVTFEIQWNLYKRTPSGPFLSVRLIKGVRLIEVVKIAQCLLTIKIQRLLWTVLKLHVVKEAIQSSSSLPFITNFNLFVNAKTLADFSPYFKDVIQYHCFKFSPVSALIEVFNNRN